MHQAYQFLDPSNVSSQINGVPFVTGNSVTTVNMTVNMDVKEDDYCMDIYCYNKRLNSKLAIG